MKIRTYAVALALAAAPGLLAAQQTTPQQGRGEQRGAWQGRRGGVDGERGGQALLRYRQQLGLTDAQVQRLQAIHQRLESRNAPIVQRIDAARRQAGLPELRARRGERGQRGEGVQGRRQRGEGRAQRGERPQLTDQQRQAFQRFREQVKPLHEEMLRNRQEALREAQAVLTPQQRAQVQQLVREHRGQRGRRGR
ncbi:MAG: hypothetical protein ACJ8J0_00265 [Longimicrobiaceae bacterium]